MAYTAISSWQLGQDWPENFGSSGTLGVFCTQGFVADDGKVFLGSAGESLSAELVTEAIISVASGVGTVAAISLPKTTTATPNTIRYFGRVFDSRGAATDYFPFNDFHLRSSLADSISFLAWANDNIQSPTRQPGDDHPTTDQMNTAINAMAYAPASTTQLGIIKTSVTPVDTASPIAVGNNDPRVNVVYNVKTYGAVGDGTSALSSSTWRAQYSIPATLSGAYLGNNTFGTLTFVDGMDTKDFVAFAYTIYLAEQNRGTYTPGSGVPLLKSIVVEVPDGTYNTNRLLGLYSSDYVRATNAVIVRSGTGAIFDVKDPTKTVITGLQFQGGTNAIITANSNTDATELDIDRCVFQGQTDYPVKSSNVATATPKTLRVTNSKFINTAGGVYNTGNQAIVKDNWFEMITTNPLLYNEAQASFTGNRITPAIASPPADYIINAGQLRAEWNIVGGESPAGKRFLRTVAGAQYTSVKHNVVHSHTDSYNIQLDVYPINVFIEDNWFQSNNGWIVNDNYVGATAGATATAAAALATSNNTFRNNQQGDSATPVLPFNAFKNGGLYFTLEGTGLGRSAATREMQVVKPDGDFANLFPDSSEAISGSWAASGVSYANTAVVAPDGTLTGINIIGNLFGTLDSGSITTVALGGAGVYTLSLYVRNYAAANIVSVYNSTDSAVVVARPLSESTEWIRLAVSFYAVAGKTYILRFNLVTGGSLNAWGFQINPGYHAAPYLYRGTSAKASVFPFVGPERPVYYAAAMPSTGDWKAGTKDLATAPTEQSDGGAKYIIDGWRRITTGANNVLNTDWVETRTLTGNFTAPVTKTGDFTWAATEGSIIVNQAGTTTATLPAAASFTGRTLYVKTIQAQTVVSASSNVVPLVGGSAGTAILAATAGKWANMVSDGTNWIIMAGN